jgi:hypothetical protein
MTNQDRHDINFIRKQLTAIEIELMPDPGEEISPTKVDNYMSSIRSTMSGMMDRLEGVS